MVQDIFLISIPLFQFLKVSNNSFEFWTNINDGQALKGGLLVFVFLSHYFCFQETVYNDILVVISISSTRIVFSDQIIYHSFPFVDIRCSFEMHHKKRKLNISLTRFINWSVNQKDKKLIDQIQTEIDGIQTRKDITISMYKIQNSSDTSIPNILDTSLIYFICLFFLRVFKISPLILRVLILLLFEPMVIKLHYQVIMLIFSNNFIINYILVPV